MVKGAVFSGIIYEEPPFRGISVRSAIGIEYSLGEDPKISAFEALPIPGVPVEEAVILSKKMYSGEEAVIVTPAPYDFRKPLVEEADIVILDGRRVNRSESYRVRYVGEYVKRKIVGFIGVPKEFIKPLLLAGVDVVVNESPARNSESSHHKARKEFVNVVEENPIALRFLRLLERESGFHDEIIYGSLTAMERPEVSSRIERMKLYEPPEGDVLILLPCAMRKPYSLSRTHKPIVEVTKRYRVHELIVTSPLILVPRELETIFPAMKYEHPPTGKRTYAEKGAAAEILNIILRRYESAGYKHVIAFLPKDYREALELVSYPMEVYEGDRLDVSRLKRKLSSLASAGDLREGSRDRVGMAKNALKRMYGISPEAEVRRFVDRIAMGSSTFGVRKDGVLKPKLPMLERLYREGIYVEAPSLRIEDIREVSGEARYGLYVPRKRKQLRSARLKLSMWMIRKLMGKVEGIYASDRIPF